MKRLSSPEARRCVLGQLADASLLVQRARDDVSQRAFHWFGHDYWLDRRRLIVLELSQAEELQVTQMDSVPVDLVGEIEFSGLRQAMASAGETMDVMAMMINGAPNKVTESRCRDLLNFAVVQPIVNPAFSSIFWLALAMEVHPGYGMGRELGTAMGTMVYDMTTFPESLREASEVRRAQVEFVRKCGSDADAAELRAMSDAVWAEWCKAFLVSRESEMEFLFSQVAFESARHAASFHVDHAGE